MLGLSPQQSEDWNSIDLAARVQAMIDVPFNGASITGSPSNNSNWSQLNNPQINAALNAAKQLTDPTQRAAQYGKIDDTIMAQAPVVPWDWDYDAEPYSTNVAFVGNLFNAEPDLSFTSLK